MLAYVLWHRPREGVALEAYEHAQIAFHRSLAHSPPVGLCGSAAFRAAGFPWLAVGGPAGGETAAVYEDWYVVEDYAALGVLNEAAVGRGHRTAHEEAARRFGAGAGGLYGLIEGRPTAQLHAAVEAPVAVWISRPAGSERRALEDLLGDGMDPERASLWRRQLVLGPAPELCLLAPEPPSGVGPARLPGGWTATACEREVLWSG